jgi:hypothetical protein
MEVKPEDLRGLSPEGMERLRRYAAPKLYGMTQVETAARLGMRPKDVGHELALLREELRRIAAEDE